MIAPKVFTVGQINRYIKNLLENDFILNSLLVQGEFLFVFLCALCFFRDENAVLLLQRLLFLCAAGKSGNGFREHLLMGPVC